MAYITQVNAVTRSKSQGAPQQRDWTYSGDIMKNRGGAFHYLAWLKATSGTPLTTVKVFTFDSIQSSPPSGFEWIDFELSYEHGGHKYKYLCFKRGEPGLAPIRDLAVDIFEDNKPNPNPPAKVSCIAFLS